MELLFDDMGIDRKAGVRRVLGTPHKEPEPLLNPEKPWEQGGGALHAIFYDEEDRKFKLWYRSSVRDLPPTAPGSASAQAEESSERVSGKRRHLLCYAESRDGVRWERPSLGLYELHGSRDNNILRETSERDSVFFNIFKDPSDPDPSRRYKAIGFDDCEVSTVANGAPGKPGVCVAYSPDGLRWPGGPRLIMSTSDLTDADCVLCRREPTTGKYVGFFRPRTHPKRRFVGYSESDDFDHWTYPRMLLTPDLGDDEWIEFYGLTVALFEKWRIGALWVYYNNPDFSPMTLELAYSRDGLHYRRAMPNVPFLPLGPDGSFDSRMTSGAAFFRHGAEFFLYYNGSNHEHGADRDLPEMQKGRVEPGQERRGGLGLARVAGANLCGLRAEVDGIVESKWMCNYGPAGVQAHAEIEKDGWIRAEILDQYGNVIPGWDRGLSRCYRAADGRLHFFWSREDLTGEHGQVSDAQGRVGHVVKLRFHLHRATLYGFQAGEEGSLPPYTA